MAAVMIRNYERTHENNAKRHEIFELSEQILLGVIMVFFGRSIVAAVVLTSILIHGIAARPVMARVVHG